MGLRPVRGRWQYHLRKITRPVAGIPGTQLQGRLTFFLLPVQAKWSARRLWLWVLTPISRLYILSWWPQCHSLNQSPSCLFCVHLCSLQSRCVDATYPSAPPGSVARTELPCFLETFLYFLFFPFSFLFRFFLILSVSFLFLYLLVPSAFWFLFIRVRNLHTLRYSLRGCAIWDSLLYGTYAARHYILPPSK